ncbi:hypothetical protein PFISCL1PPCAC_10361 [Pristionchus fissidentatus]|uniref:RGS domain-containing protein n=1 Tax=Pristionchus fissidentatus TaxID=1538716 RepID=A0AAV5VKZ1_9BILA|nr:hypothetical protein PFISCL1PPCAC_10361 [Pristionchus fissidentatus]
MNKAVSFINRIKKSSSVSSGPSSSSAGLREAGDPQVVLNDSVHGRHVRLAHSIDSLLSDPSAISYFIHFFESSGKVNLINFWIHVRSFKDSTSLGNVSMAGLLLSDARRIYEKYVDEKSRHNIGLPKVISSPLKDSIDKEEVNDDIFNDAQKFVYHLFKLRYFDEFKKSIYYKKHEFDVFHNTTFDLEDLMYSQDLLPIVMESVDDEIDRNRTQFILAVHMFESDSSEGNDEEIEADAMAIYERFISLQARMSMDVSDSTRTHIESLICTTEGKPARNCFEAAKKATLAILSRKYRQSITESTVFKDYLQELNMSIENTIELPSLYRRSDRTDSHSGTSSSNGTTVSMPRLIDYLERRWSTSSTSTTVNSNVNSPRSSRLAEVDELGRYKPLYDNSLVSVKKEGKMKNRLRKYIDKNGLREEEMADEVARTIIADVIASTNSRH